MQKLTIADTEFQFEKLNEEDFKRGAAAFRVIDKDGDESFWVSAPATIGKFDDGVASPKDGKIVAFCQDKDDALMVASSINISVHITRVKMDTIEVECKKLAAELGYDLNKMDEEIRRLKAEGKSEKEVSEILKPRMDEFLTAEGKAKKDASPKERSEW